MYPSHKVRIVHDLIVCIAVHMGAILTLLLDGERLSSMVTSSLLRGLEQDKKQELHLTQERRLLMALNLLLQTGILRPIFYRYTSLMNNE